MPSIERLSTRLSRIEDIKAVDKGVLFIDLNEDGTYGKHDFTKQQLDEYAKKMGYGHIFIDDIPETNE